MSKTGPIVMIEDDQDDQEVISDILSELRIDNPVKIFSKGPEALHYLRTTTEQPFITLCDINLPGMTGVDLKKLIDADPVLCKRSIPFIFFSTGAGDAVVRKAFTELTVQGFFQKTSSIDEIKDTLRVIVDYWKKCKHPLT